MDSGIIRETGRGLTLDGVRHFDLAQVLDCGQCFRWSRVGENAFAGIVRGVYRVVSQQGDRVVFHGADRQEFDRIWKDYFDLGREYGPIKELLSADPILRRAISFAPGIRVARQQPWEALCSFILSQNNNIPRIRGLVERLCREFGDPVEGGFGFPEPRALAGRSLEELAPVRSGFRAKYIVDAAGLVESGGLPLGSLYTLPLPEARAELQRIKGVGPKVANCALLYGFGRVECVPEDVWIKRVLGAFYPDGLPPEFASCAGIAQQYLFHYARRCPGWDRPQD